MNNPESTLATPPTLPLEIEGIDADWLTTALRTRFAGVTVRRAEIVDMIRGTCTKIRLRLDMDAAGQRAGIPETVILKGGFEPHSRDMFVTHEKEVRAYRDLFPSLKLHSPTCYYADFDEDRRQGIVIIEDLVARGVTFCHPQTPQTHDQVARRLSALAAFHAATWNSPDLDSDGRWSWARDILSEACTYMSQLLQPDPWQHFIASPRGAAASVRFHDREWMADSLERLTSLGRDLPRCLIHGDTHLGNLYIDTDGTPGFFDPQPFRAPSLVEVSYHIAGALDPGDRGRWEGALVRHYLDELAGQGIEPPAFDEAMRQYAAFLAFGYCIFIVNDAHFQPEAINTAYTARFSAAMIDNRTVETLAAVR